MARNEFIEMLEKVFRGRGYSIETSSEDNSYMLLSRDGERTAVGFSPMGASMTPGEAEMFLSMAENDSANDMLYIHPSKMKKKARAALKSGDVALWDRTTLAIAIGEAMLLEFEGQLPQQEKGSVMDWFSDNVDVDPLAEVRKFEKKIRSQETSGSFQVKKVTMGKVEGPDELPSGEEGEGHGGTRSKEEVVAVSMKALDVDLSAVLEEASVRQMDVSSVFSMFDQPDVEAEGSPPPEKEKKQKVEVEERKLAEWSDTPLARQRIGGDEAVSLAGGPPSMKPAAELRPHLLYWIRYVMRSEDGKKEVVQEKPFLMDCTDGEVLDLPDSFAEELIAIKSPRSMDDERPVVPSRLDGPGAVENVRKKLLGISLLKDDLVHDGPGSVIYEETRYTLKRGSLEVVRTSRVLLPYWIGRGENGDPIWAVEAHTGSLRHLS